MTFPVPEQSFVPVLVINGPPYAKRIDGLPASGRLLKAPFKGNWAAAGGGGPECIWGKSWRQVLPTPQT